MIFFDAISSVATTVIAFLFIGYFFKLMWMSRNTEGLTTMQILVGGTFWSPDLAFWLFAIGFSSVGVIATLILKRCNDSVTTQHSVRLTKLERDAFERLN